MEVLSEKCPVILVFRENNVCLQVINYHNTMK